MLKLLVAVDGSEPSRRAIDAAARLARSVGGVQAVLVNVRDEPVIMGDLPTFDAEAFERVALERQQALLSTAQEQARSAGLRHAQTQAAVGAAAQEIVRAASALEVDQIVMGTRGMSALGGLLLGSVAQRVVHLADVPVLLVK